MSSARPTLPWLGRQMLRTLYESIDLSSRISPKRYPINPPPLNQPASLFMSPGPRFPRAPWSPFLRISRQYTSNARRKYTSGGLLLVSLAPNPSTASTVAATCSAAADSTITGNTSSILNAAKFAGQAWPRTIHTGRGRGRTTRVYRRAKSSNSYNEKAPATGAQQKKKSASEPQPEPVKQPAGESSVSKYFHLPHLPSMPHLPHRPTKEEFLAAANGFWERLKVRFKWASIRSMRPWNIDEWGAFVSWFLFGHLVWILVGTTTFFSLIIFSINTVVAQETLARWVGDYLTESAGLTVIFESAIVPRWKDGVISFRNVFVSRRPGQIKSSVSKGSSSNAAAVAAAEREDAPVVEEDDGNYTQFDVTLNTVNVTLSFVKWWNGKGLLKDVEIKGVRGVIDRTSVEWSGENVDPLSYRHEHQPGDFEIDSFKMEDLLVTIHQPKGFRPFSVSIFSCELPQLRKQFMFYDFLSANHMSGSYDGSLFTIHPRQIHGVLPGQDRSADPLGEPDAWKKHSRLRIDGLKIDHLNRGVEGPFGWIYEGNVDIVADVRFPHDSDDSITKVMSDFYDRLEEAVTSNRYLRILDRPIRQQETVIINEPSTFEGTNTSNTNAVHLVNDHPEIYHDDDLVSVPTPPRPGEEPPRYLVMDLRIHLNDVKATVPVFTSNLSYVNQALVRPIVAYINAKRTYIPIGCRIVKRASDFDGSWSIFDCGLMDDASAEVYTAFARDVEDQQSRVRRLKKVGFWTLSLAIHALFVGMAGNVI
ncbi:mitochondrial distribution and morphology proteins-domain-containing protein [Xylaria bambusicola]|uniref:mitochondrial distribution and morphology proteins-domain-containing protein n=1 Tax=Xylaria bambusicola TaxID=326684 RepID=UPI002008D7DB|nr:mitochondrial distribution and morphology proteins-domain-containing protein [Xylaria bambusicola]KAI0523828.1 mitochondrial distribution and morphology proteins-domain-containing protein [Xylaria bambusicola]